MIGMQISVISLMILPSPWLCGSSVVNMSSSTREFGKCVKTQLQLVCSNYGSGEFVTTSLLIKRDFLIWINVIYKGKFQSSRRHLLPSRASPELAWWIRSLPTEAGARVGLQWEGVTALLCVEGSLPQSPVLPLAKSSHCERSGGDFHKRVVEPIWSSYGNC